MNLHNYGSLVGRLIREIQYFPNSDGSCKALLKLAVMDNFKSKQPNGEVAYGYQWPELEAFIPANSQISQLYASLHEGDKVSVLYSIRTQMYTDKNGEKHYPTKLQIETIQPEEGKQVREQRYAQKQKETESQQLMRYDPNANTQANGYAAPMAATEPGQYPGYAGYAGYAQPGQAPVAAPAAPSPAAPQPGQAPAGPAATGMPAAPAAAPVTAAAVPDTNAPLPFAYDANANATPFGAVGMFQDYK